jgi:phosphatidylglycerophosphatase A
MKQFKHDINTFIASFFGIGFLPGMPGTWGSLAAFGFYMLIPKGAFTGFGLVFSIPALIVLYLISVYVSSQAELKLGHDAGQIVIDEVCGYFIAVMLLRQSWLIGLYAFVLFRVFDIAKPFPISRSQNLPKGWGVVTDDVIAGIFANVLLQIMIIIYPKFFGL